MDLFRSLSDHSVEYLLIGGYAMAFHGLPRATKDLDIFVHATKENSERVCTTLRTFGVPFSIDAYDFAYPERIIQIGVAPNRVDVITSASGIEFEDAWREKLVVDVEGVGINVIGRSALIKNKLSTGRLRDKADAEALQKLDNQ
jgi:hypothetical protein